MINKEDLEADSNDINIVRAQVMRREIIDTQNQISDCNTQIDQIKQRETQLEQ